MVSTGQELSECWLTGGRSKTSRRAKTLYPVQGRVLNAFRLLLDTSALCGQGLSLAPFADRALEATVMFPNLSEAL